MKTWRTLVLAALALAAGVWLGWPSGEGTAAALTLAIPAEALRLGEVWAQSDFRVSLPLRNDSDREIEVVHLGCAPCGCCKFAPPTLVIPPREERQIAVTIDLSPRNERESQSAVRDYRLNVVVAARGNGPPWTWELSGKVRSVLAFSPARTDFAQSLIQGVPPPAREIAIRAHVPLAALALECDDARLAAYLERDAGDPRGYRLTVQPQEPLREGALDVSVVLKPVAESGAPLPPVTYQVVGDVLGNVRAFPASVAFGPRALGEAAEQIVTLRSHTGEPFELVDVRCSSPDVRILPVEDVSDRSVSKATRDYRVRLTCATSGGFAAQAELAIRAGPGRQATVVVVPIFAHVSPRAASTGRDSTRPP
jgi:hypothetical protein